VLGVASVAEGKSVGSSQCSRGKEVVCLDCILVSVLVLWWNFGDVGLAAFERNFDFHTGTPA
jgi:hypothetical protein